MKEYEVCAAKPELERIKALKAQALKPLIDLMFEYMDLNDQHQDQPNETKDFI